MSLGRSVRNYKTAQTPHNLVVPDPCPVIAGPIARRLLPCYRPMASPVETRRCCAAMQRGIPVTRRMSHRETSMTQAFS
jgi:hypothetical protein